MPNKSEFKKVCEELEADDRLTFDQIGRIFGQPFWELIVLALMDAQDASRAIMNAINRLRKGDEPEVQTDAQD